MGKRQWRVRKRDFVAGEAARRGLDGGVAGDRGGSLVESVRFLGRELNREVTKARVWGSIESLSVERWGMNIGSRMPCK